jgi:hypothetical protein
MQLNQMSLKERIAVESEKQILAYLKDLFQDKSFTYTKEYKELKYDYENEFKFDITHHLTARTITFKSEYGNKKVIELSRVSYDKHKPIQYGLQLSSLKTKVNNFIKDSLNARDLFNAKQKAESEISAYNKMVREKILMIVKRYNEMGGLLNEKLDLPENRYKFEVNNKCLWPTEKITDIQINFMKLTKPRFDSWQDKARLKFTITENGLQLGTMRQHGTGNECMHGIPYLDAEHLNGYQNDLNRNKELSKKIYAIFDWIERNWEKKNV